MIKWYQSTSLFMVLLLLIGLSAISDELHQTTYIAASAYSVQSADSEREFYYKSGYPDYCPAGMPDFSQVQDFTWPPDGTIDPGYCGPVALANCFWWFDSKFEPLPVVPPGISDNYPLVGSYHAAFDDHDSSNVTSLIGALATSLNTNLLAPGTNIVDLDAGVRDWLASRGLLDDYDVNLYPCVDFTWDFIAGEVKRSQDVILLLGFYIALGGNPQECCRIGGHYVTVAGVDSANALIALSDPFLDLANPPPPSHNDAAVVSHDLYAVGMIDPGMCVAVPGCLFLPDYPADPIAYEFFDQNGGTTCPGPGLPGPIYAVIEFAEVICPRETPDTWYWKPDTTYAQTGMPDFPSQLPCHSGPTAVTNCLWWYGAMDYYQFTGAWELKDELFSYFHSDTIFDPWGGTDVHVMEQGLTQFFWDPDPKWQFYETTYQMPDFREMAESLMVCQDVILLIGNWWFDGEQWWRDGGRYVTMAGVDTAAMMVALSDPETDNAEAGGTGRVRPPAHAGVVHDPRDATHWTPVTLGSFDYPVSHDSYPVLLDSPSPGGSWWLPGFPRGFSPTGANCPTEFRDLTLANPDPATFPYHAEVEYAVMICPGEPQMPQTDTCEYYKAPYEDYAPYGMPDFDQKQNGWIGGPIGGWSFCGPVALANCLWWFDSKFEPVPVPPPIISDGYPLVSAYGPWDDHDPSNVIPLVDSLARYTSCFPGGIGTFILDLANGAQAWLAQQGLLESYTVTLFPGPPVELIRDEVMRSQDVILLLGFYEIPPTGGDCIRLGGHYVTVAGVCIDNDRICISDPYFDANEGEPPAGSAHGSAVHNDAAFISGPHGQIQHDPYNLFMQQVCPQYPPLVEIVDYPDQAGDVGNFFELNPVEWSTPPIPYQGGEIHTLIDYALIICPLDTCANQYPGDVDNNGVIDNNDIHYLAAYIDSGGPAPPVPANADPDGDCDIDYTDIALLDSYVNDTGSAPVQCTCVNPTLTCCRDLTGNVNNSGPEVDLSDLIYLVNYLFLGGPVPWCLEEANINGDPFGVVDLSDLIAFVNYLFLSGPPPAHCQ
ncbi:dockerin type I repeat-containing protein [bacterium]|nr:dockerin type I repeat-containing protein [bacterium]